MVVSLKKTLNGYWTADLKDLPGSPPIGYGKTQAEAIADLFYQLIAGHSDYLLYVKLDKCEVIIEK
jgi:hypothetical protein